MKIHIKLPSRRQSGAWFVVAMFLVVISYNLYDCCQIKQRELEERQNELYRLRDEIAVAEFSNTQLKAQVAHLGTDQGAEEVAREKLGLIKPGEIAYVVLGAENLLQPSPAPQAVTPHPPAGPMMRLMHWFFLG